MQALQLHPCKGPHCPLQQALHASTCFPQ